MRALRRSLSWALAGMLATAAAGVLLTPGSAQAEKTPVDCSGRRTDCYTYRRCTQWINHECWEYTTSYWYWYV